MNTVVDDELRATPLTALTHESLNLLSSLLNTKKVLLTVCPDQLSRHRDWRGVSSLANITSEVAASIREYNDKTRRVIDLWIHKNDGTATVGRLLDILQWIDRNDVYDDLLELHSKNKLIVKQVYQNGNQVAVPVAAEEDLITDDDMKYGCPQYYHAYVLFAREDKDFVNELLRRLRDNGFKLCTEDDLLPGHATRFAPVSRLISERCSRIILIYSPDFLRSPANTFFMNLAQADGIEKKQLKIIPIMYRHCMLPLHLTYYHNLYYSPPEQKAPYEFWGKLERSLEVREMPRLTYPSSNNTSIKIEEVPNSQSSRFTPQKKQDNYLNLPSVPTDTASMDDLRRLNDSNSFETKSLNSTIETKKKKGGTLRKILNTIKGKKEKKAIMVQN